MPRKRESRIYWRNGRAYCDLRDFQDVLKQEEPDREALGTPDPDVAAKRASSRVEELEKRRRSRDLLGVEKEATLALFAQHHLVQKAKAKRVGQKRLADSERELAAAVAFFGAGRDLRSISVRDAEAFVAWLRERPNGRGSTLSASSQHQYLVSLSNLYRRAQGEGCVPPGYNPVRAIMDKPRPQQEEARWLEVHEGALLLEAARLHPSDRDDETQSLHAILAAMLLTGGRKSEVLGLKVEDVSFERMTVTFRPNRWRGLKTRTSHRSVPLWPQLEEILREHLHGGQVSGVSRLLFPSARTGELIHDVQKALDTAAECAGWGEGEITTKVFRHSYCAARLQTLDRGAPVSPWTVGREMGHGGMTLVNKVYGHLGTVRHRSDVVEYRVEKHADLLRERLRAVRSWRPPRCRGTTAAGEPCRTRGNLSAKGFCLWHDPARKAKAKQARPHARRQEGLSQLLTHELAPNVCKSRKRDRETLMGA